MTDRHRGALRRTTALSAGLIALGVGPMAAAAHAAPVAPEPFEISGSLSTPLYPGSLEPLDLTLHNPNHVGLRLQSLTVTIQSVTPLPTRTCSASDFTIDQATLPMGPGRLLPADADTVLSDAGLTTSQLPHVRMLETGVNQDGCQGASLALRYTGSATGADRDVPGGGGEGDHDHDGDDDHDGAHDGDWDSGGGAGHLPGTGGSGREWSIAGAGASMLAAGLGGVGFARRRKGARS